MHIDARVRSGLIDMIAAIEAPPVPLGEIRNRISRQHTTRRPQPLNLRYAVAAAGIVAVISSPLVSPAVVQTIETRYRAALQAMGGTAPPAAPSSFVARLSSKRATLSAAQSRVHFTIVPPSGLPADAVPAGIVITATGDYSNATHAWRAGSPAVTFSFRRSGERSFSLLADRYDPANAMPPKFMFEARDPAPDGRLVIIKHRNFAWRNGDQIMTAQAGADISPADIESIRAAMHGLALQLRDLHVPSHAGGAKLYRLLKP